MTLAEALREIVNQFGTEKLKSQKLINMLNDYQAFGEYPATKLIIRDLREMGYMEKILQQVGTAQFDLTLLSCQHGFIDACGYKENLSKYVFDSIAYALDKKSQQQAAPEIDNATVDSFFPIDEPEQNKPQGPQSSPTPATGKTQDYFTIGQAFFNKKEYDKARTFIEQAILKCGKAAPVNYHKLLGDSWMNLGRYSNALDSYNDALKAKADELNITAEQLRKKLQGHSTDDALKDFNGIITCYYYCLYGIGRVTKSQWLNLLKAEARAGVMSAILLCAQESVDPIENHVDIYFNDLAKLKDGDYVYEDGTFAHEQSESKKAIGQICLMETSDFEKMHGWTHGYIIGLKGISGPNWSDKYNNERFPWSLVKENLSFPHSHYTEDDINHIDKIKKFEVSHLLKFNPIEKYPLFRQVKNYPYEILGLNMSEWFIPDVPLIERMKFSYYFGSGLFWTSSQADKNSAIVMKPFHASWENCFRIEDKFSQHEAKPVAAF